MNASGGIDERSLASAIAVGILGALTIWLVPGFVRLIADHAHLDGHQVGYVTSLNINSMAVSIGCTTFLLRRVRWRVLAMLGLGLIICGSLYTATVHAYAPLIVARMVVGAGEGICIGVSFAAFGRARIPSRAFAIYMMSGASLSAGILLALPALQAGLGTDAIFIAIAALGLVTMWSIRRFPESNASAQPGEHSSVPHSIAHIDWWLAISILAAVFLFFFAQGSVWSLFARIGEVHGVQGSVISRALAAGTLAGILGSSLAGVLSPRLGRWPIVLSGAVSISSFLMLLGNVDGWGLVLAAILLVASWNFTQPLLSGLCCDADRQGRVVCAMGCVQTIGFGCGPAAAALLFDGHNIAPVIWTGTAALAASLAALLIGLRGRLAPTIHGRMQ
jgi:predicted MFS family arabinose efflux permease